MRMNRTFRGGAHPHEHKTRTKNTSIEKMPLPKEVVIPIQQHIGAPAEPLVQKGEPVKTGQLIAKAAKYVSVPIHATLSGTVKAIEPRPHPFGTKITSIIIESDETDTWFNPIEAPDDISKLSSIEIKNRILDAGIAGMGGAAFPTHVKLSPPPGKSFDSVIINGAECEPYLTADHRLMLEKADELLKGLEIILDILNVKQGYIAIEKNKPDAIQLLQQKTSDQKRMTVVPLLVKYPQGAEKQLINAVTGRVVPAGGLPVDAACLVHNVGTAIAIYEAVYYHKPLIERVVTVTGDAVNNPKNLQVRLGTSFSDLIDYCEGRLDHVKLINGGPMMGIAQTDAAVPVIKGTSGILILQQASSNTYTEAPCIGCARCVDTCPMKLVPTQIAHLIKYDQTEKSVKNGLMDCMECGTCAYVCPAHIK